MSSSAATAGMNSPSGSTSPAPPPSPGCHDHPARHPSGGGPPLRSSLDHAADRLLATLYGYAAPWKDPSLLVGASAHTETSARVVLTGPSWEHRTQTRSYAATAVGNHGRGGVGLITVPGYLGPQQRRALIQESDLAVFPYQYHPSFQGSGAIADYLAHGIPVLATDVANMAELTGDAGLIVPASDPDAFAGALSRFGSARQRESLTRAARRRAAMFTATAHAQACLAFYERVLHRNRSRRR